MTTDAFDITIGADIAEIAKVSEMLESVMQSPAFLPDSVLDTQLAVEEVVTNIIMHGYSGGAGTIHISCSSENDRVVIRISDNAPAFDPLSLPDPDIDAGVQKRQIGGLGVYLVRQVMDDISYRYENGQNILTLTKKRNG